MATSRADQQLILAELTESLRTYSSLQNIRVMGLEIDQGGLGHDPVPGRVWVRLDYQERPGDRPLSRRLSIDSGISTLQAGGTHSVFARDAVDALKGHWPKNARELITNGPG